MNDPLLQLQSELKDAEAKVSRLPWTESPLPERTLEFWNTGLAEPYTYEEQVWNDFFPNTHSAICSQDGAWTFYERERK